LQSPRTVADAISTVYAVGLPVAVVTIVLAIRLPEHPLRDHTQFDPAPEPARHEAR
jgi:hypothetical protein